MKRRIDLRAKRKKAVRVKKERLKGADRHIIKLLLDCLVITNQRLDALFSDELDPVTPPMQIKITQLNATQQKLSRLNEKEIAMIHRIDAGQVVDEKSDSEW